MVGPAATRDGGGRGDGVAENIANSDDEGGAAAAAATSAADVAPTSTPTPSSPRFFSSSSSSPRLFLSRLLPRPPPARVLLSEASGAVGDLGTFLPLTLGLVAAVGLDFGTTLLFTGFYNIVSGLAFGVPMPVQPMKTIAAVAVASVSSSSSSSSDNPPVSLEEVMAAGMFVSAVVLFLGLTRLVDLVNKVVPRSIVAGLQLGVGLKLAASGVKSVFLVAPAAAGSKKAKMGWRAAGGAEGWALGAAALVFLFVSTVAPRSKREEEEERASRFSSSSPALPLPRRLQEALLERRKRREQRGGGGDESESSSSSGASAELSSLPLASPPPPPSAAPPPADAADAAAVERGGEAEGNRKGPESPPSSAWQVPSALLVTALGVALAFASAPAAALAALRFGPSRVTAAAPTARDWINGITRAGGLAQLPLTTLNSVIAVSHLADSLYSGGGSGEPQPRRNKARWRPSRVAVAVGLYNLLGGWFGAVPACMGSGGLAAQHKFGARGGAAPVLLGIFKISLALAFGSSLSSILRFFPSGLLGAMLALAGAELAAAARAGSSSGGGGCCGGGGGGGKEGEAAGGKNSALSSPRFFAFAALTAAAILGIDDPAAGFAVGWGLWLSTEAWERGIGFLRRAWREKRRRKEERRRRPTTSEKSEV